MDFRQLRRTRPSLIAFLKNPCGLGRIKRLVLLVVVGSLLLVLVQSRWLRGKHLGFTTDFLHRHGTLTFKVKDTMYWKVHPAAIKVLRSKSYSALEDRLNLTELDLEGLPSRSGSGGVGTPRWYLKRFSEIRRTDCDEYGEPQPRFPSSLVIHDAFVDGWGRVIVPSDASLTKLAGIGHAQLDAEWYGELNGGCCEWDWKSPRVGDKVKLSGDFPILDFAICLSQHHGSTFSHLMNEVVPRAILSANVTDPSTGLAAHFLVSDNPFESPQNLAARKWLPMVGIDASRLVILGRERIRYAFVKTLVIPPPPVDVGTYPPCVAWDESPELISRRSNCDESFHSRNGSILVLKRRTNPESERSCTKERCLANFGELRSGLESAFGSRHRIAVFPPNPSPLESVCMFGDARVIVGIHGAGFNNMFFAKPGTLVVHIADSAWARWSTYKQLADKRNLTFIGLVDEKAKHGARNIRVDVTRIVETISAHLCGALDPLH